MRTAVPAAADVDEDELLNLIDLVYDYYEANGLLDIDIDDDSDDDVPADELYDYITRMLRRDKGASLDLNLVKPLLDAYLRYEASIE